VKSFKRELWISDFGFRIGNPIQNPPSKILNRILPQLLVVILLLCGSTHGQEIRLTGNSPVATSQPAVVDEPYSYPKILLAMGLVVALILTLKWGAGKVAPGMAGGRSGKAISILSRLPVGPKQQLMLVRIGRRAVLVGNTGGQMNSLCEITDADELAHLIGQVESEKPTTVVSGAFASLFKKREREFEPEASEMAFENKSEPVADDQMAQTVRRELLGLTERVRGLSKDLNGL
jgi:flagellar biogenesis protein FliO